MKQYTRKQLKEYARLGLARDLTEVDPDTLPKWYEKIGVSRGIYGMNEGGTIMIYCKQVPPEYQESPIFQADMFPENMVVCGNRDFKEWKTAVFALVENTLDNGDLQEALEDLETGGYYSAFYESAQEAIEEFLPPSKGEYSQDDITALQGLVKAYTQCSRAETNNIFCRVLSIVDGKKWGWKIIRGCCQSDWNEIFYTVDDWSREALAAFEIEYFNMGSEWIIDDGEFNPDTDSPLNINGYSVYITAQDEEGIRKELAAVEGCSPSDLVLYVFEGYVHIPQYKAV